MQVVLKIGLLQWQIVLGDISKWFYKPCGLLFGWPYKTGNTVHYLFYYMYYGDNFTTVNKMLFFVKQNWYYQWYRLSLFIYCVRECMSDNVCSLIKLHPYSAKVLLLLYVQPERLLWVNGIASKRSQLHSRLMMFHATFVKDKCGQYWLCSKLLHVINYR